MDPRILIILKHAIMAPSGDNCQPWRFVVNGLQVDLHNDPERDTSLYNLKQRASLIAHGALLENVRITAPTVGLHSEIQLFPDAVNQAHIATIRFTEGLTETPALFSTIAERHTNRGKYRPVKISDSQADTWQALPERPGQQAWIARDPKQIKALAGLLSMNDRLVFEIPELHRFLFEQIRWTDDEAEKTGDGLDIKTLGLNAMDRVAFKFLRYWGVVDVLNKVGFSRIIQLKAKHLLKSASAIVVVTLPGSGAEDYVEGGRLWQRLLLQWTSEGLTAQPIAGLACLMQAAVESGLGGKVADVQVQRLLGIREALARRVGAGIVLALFRVGWGRPVVRALRREVERFL